MPISWDSVEDYEYIKYIIREKEKGKRAITKWSVIDKKLLKSVYIMTITL